ncbi:hypothetical protein V490_05138 [Pseudogymnoascus sp. VKM F-3557]|nr:hypothetical protein V490_05138 [Pseudogymnoascus sp. VKM F-3557]
MYEGARSERHRPHLLKLFTCALAFGTIGILPRCRKFPLRICRCISYWRINMATLAVPHRRKLKVKTGCITCRIRKVKCDEEKPSCKRCNNTGRKCDGYASPPGSKGSSPEPTLIVVRASRQILKQPDIRADVTLLPVLGTPEECRFLDFFLCRTAPALSGAFDTSFWSSLLLQLSRSEPAIRHALLAVGSLHAQYETSSDARPENRLISHPFTLQQYNQAIRSLKNKLSHGQESVEVTLMCCILFICLECLRNNRELAVNHLQNGLNILGSARTKETDCRTVKSSFFGSDFVEQNLYQIFSRLLAQLTLFGMPVSDASAIELSKPSSVVVDPLNFNSIHEAKASFDTLMLYSLRFVRAAMDNKRTGQQQASIQTRQFDLQAQFLQWLCSFEALMKTIETRRGANDQREPLLLRIQYKAAYIWLSACLAPDETSFDAYIEDFQSITTWARCLAMIPTSSSLFSLDMAIIPPLFLTAVKCRKSSIRHEAIELLYAIPGREGLWDARLHAKVAERLASIEESGLDTANDVPFEEFRVKNAHVLSDMAVDPPRHFVIFFTKPNGLDADYVTWEEDIVLN